ncbi:MAG: flagellar basal body L-ring protein FlgH [Candidatus Margulisiibacteriota bacterium]
MPKYLLGACLVLLLAVSAIPKSLWTEEASSPYSASRAHKIGDIITILIEESTSAAQSAGTNTSKKTGVNADMLTNWSRVASALGTSRDDMRNKGQISAGDSYEGTGETTRRSMVRANISATVTNVLPNGRLYLIGTHKVNVNDETQTIIVAGIIRPEDISAENAIYSSQIAEAQISIKGSGTVASKQTPGILSRLFGWMF